MRLKAASLRGTPREGSGSLSPLVGVTTGFAAIQVLWIHPPLLVGVATGFTAIQLLWIQPPLLVGVTTLFAAV